MSGYMAKMEAVYFFPKTLVANFLASGRQKPEENNINFKLP
jgi:hypothetical protein